MYLYVMTKKHLPDNDYLFFFLVCVCFFLWSLCVTVRMWRVGWIFSCLRASHADEETFITSLTVSKWLSHHSTCLFQSTPFQSSHSEVLSFFYCSLLMCKHMKTFYWLWSLYSIALKFLGWGIIGITFCRLFSYSHFKQLKVFWTNNN